MLQKTEDLVELQRVWPRTIAYEELGTPYYFIPDLQLPDGCSPPIVDALVCTEPRDGYSCRLFLSQVVQSREARNWNHKNVRIIERNWNAFSWKIGEPPYRATDIVLGFVRALQ